MNTIAILYLWVAYTGTWQYSGEFPSAAACRAAVVTLGVKPERARCVFKADGSPT